MTGPLGSDNFDARLTRAAPLLLLPSFLPSCFALLTYLHTHAFFFFFVITKLQAVTGFCVFCFCGEERKKKLCVKATTNTNTNTQVPALLFVRSSLETRPDQTAENTSDWLLHETQNQTPGVSGNIYIYFYILFFLIRTHNGNSSSYQYAACTGLERTHSLKLQPLKIKEQHNRFLQ